MSRCRGAGRVGDRFIHVGPGLGTYTGGVSYNWGRNASRLTEEKESLMRARPLWERARGRCGLAYIGRQRSRAYIGSSACVHVRIGHNVYCAPTRSTTLCQRAQRGRGGSRSVHARACIIIRGPLKKYSTQGPYPLAPSLRNPP